MKMTCYSVQPRDWIFAKDCRFLSFPKNMGINFGKNINKSLTSKYSQNVLDNGKQLLQMHLNILQKEWFKKKKGTNNRWFTWKKKIADKIARFSKTLPQNKSEINEEILREKYIFPELRQKIIDYLRLKED